MKPTYIVILIIVVATLGVGIFTLNASRADTTVNTTGIAPQESTDTMMKGTSRYVDYTPDLFEKAKDKKRVYFFHAAWCPTCKATNAEILGNPNGIPEDVILFKTDYDSNTALKKQYAITYQHTFVLVDAEGKELKKWNGGGLEELAAHTK